MNAIDKLSRGAAEGESRPGGYDIEHGDINTSRQGHTQLQRAENRHVGAFMKGYDFRSEVHNRRQGLPAWQ